MIQSEHLTQAVRVTPNNNNATNLSSMNNMSQSSAGLPVIVHPTHLVPVLPAASQSVVKRVMPLPTPVSAITPQLTPPVIVKSEQGKHIFVDICLLCSMSIGINGSRL